MVEDLTSAFRGIAESGKTPWWCSDGPVSLAPSNPFAFDSFPRWR